MDNQNWQNDINIKNGTAILEGTIEQRLYLDNRVGALIIDMQPAFLSNIDESERTVLVSSHLEMIRFLAANHVPIVILEYGGHGRTQKEIRQEIDKLAQHEYIAKYGDDGFTEESLHDRLKDWQIQNLIVMGINASFCVKKTARSAMEKGYSIHTARQLIANQSPRQDEFRKDVPSWYEHNGIYLPDFRELCKTLKP